MSELTDKLFKIGEIIYIAVEEPVADDISETVVSAANEIKRLQAQNDRLMARGIQDMQSTIAEQDAHIEHLVGELERTQRELER